MARGGIGRKVLWIGVLLILGSTAFGFVKGLVGAVQTNLGTNIVLPYDAEVEYLESTGTQYIDTETDCSSLDFVLSVECPRVPNWGWVHQGDANGTWIGTGYNASQKKNYVYPKNYNWKYEVNQYFDGSMKTVVFDAKCGIYVDGDLAQSFTVTLGKDSIAGIPLTICAWYDFARKGLQYYNCIIGKMTLRVQSVLVCDFIPVRFTNESGVSEGAMYDRVTRRLFRNSGSGSFIIGPDKE